MRTFQRLCDFAAAKGQTIGTSSWVTIDQKMIDQFAALTGDHQWIHVDPERTKSELNMPTIAHGFLTISMVPRFTQEIFQVESVKRVINYGANKIRFTDAVPVGSQIAGTAKLIKAALGDDMLRATLEVTIEKQGSDKPVAIIESVTLMFE